MKTKRVFTPIEKATDEAGSENKEADGGIKSPSAHTVRERSSLMGFTLLEIMITVVIVGVLAALAIPSYWGALERSRQREAVVNLGLLLDSQKRYYLEYDPGSYTTDFADLDMDNPNTNAKYFRDFVRGYFDATGQHSGRLLDKPLSQGGLSFLRGRDSERRGRYRRVDPS